MNLKMTRKEIYSSYLNEIMKEYDCIINTSIFPGRTSVSLEKIAVNWSEDSVDGEYGVLGNGRKIAEKGPDTILSRIPLEEILHSLRSIKIPSQISLSAGTSFQNEIFYLSLYHSKSKAGLINFPLETSSALQGEYPSMTIDLMIRSVEAVIQKII